jgi:hypothetical protein
MKLIRNIKLASLTLGVLLMSSCDRFLDVNVDPNRILNPPPNTILTSAQVSLGVVMGGSMHRFPALFVQQFSGQGAPGTQTRDFDRYIVTETDVNNVWRTQLFGEVLADLAQLRTLTEGENPRYAGMAKIMQAYTFQMLVDGWGDVPFTEALQFAENLRPTYDPSDEVYTNLIGLLNEGVANLEEQGTLLPGADDLIYGGDVEKWQRFANALKLRLYIHHFPKLEQAGQQGIAALINANSPLMQNNADNFRLPFQASAGRTNPIDQFETRRLDQFFPGANLVNLMNARNDPRRESFFLPFPAAGQFTGAPAGAPQSVNFSRIGPYLRGEQVGTSNVFAGDAPLRMFTFAEQNFILAEYYARTADLTQANQYHQAGITASMDLAAVPAAARDAYLANSPTASLKAGNAIQNIIEEKYVANYGVPMQPWTDWRRTGYPEVIPVQGAAFQQVPRILPYSDLERVANPENTPVRDDLTVPSVFWDPGR